MPRSRDFFPARFLVRRSGELERQAFGTRRDGRRYPKFTARSNILSYANNLARSGWIFMMAHKSGEFHVELWRRRGRRIRVTYDDSTERVIKVEDA